MLEITVVVLRVVWFLVHSGSSLFIRDLPVGVQFVMDHRCTHQKDVSVVRRLNESRYLQNEFLIQDFQTLVPGWRFQMVMRKNGMKGIIICDKDNKEMDFISQ